MALMVAQQLLAHTLALTAATVEQHDKVRQRRQVQQQVSMAAQMFLAVLEALAQMVRLMEEMVRLVALELSQSFRIPLFLQLAQLEALPLSLVERSRCLLQAVVELAGLVVVVVAEIAVQVLLQASRHLEMAETEAEVQVVKQPFGSAHQAQAFQEPLAQAAMGSMALGVALVEM